MLPRPAALAGLLAQIFLATATSAFELEYVSHLPLYVPDIDLTEPSGIAVDPDGSGFWIVSDEARTVFRLDADGETGAFLDRDDRLRDLEGVAVDADQERLLLISERDATIVVVSLDAPRRVEVIDVETLQGAADLTSALKDRKNGLEGIVVDPRTGTVLVLKERDPRLLIEIAPSLDRVVSVRSLEGILPDDEDVSGITADPLREGLWIVSDIGKSVHFLPRQKKAAVTFDLFWRDGEKKRRLNNVEGVALSPDSQSLFFVSDDDQSSKLLQFKIVD